MLIFFENQILQDKEPFSIALPGSSLTNYFLKGLQYKLTVNPDSTVSNVFLTSGDKIQDEKGQFNFVKNGNQFEYFETSGTNATGLGIASPGANFKDGIGFYFTITLENIFGISKKIKHRFFVRDPENTILIDSDLLKYKSPYPVLFDNLVLPVNICFDAKNEAGVLKRGGVKSVEVFDTPTAPDNNYVVTVPETAIENFKEITVPDRTSENVIPGFVIPPGSPDFSMFYHFITFRLRAKLGSSVFRDIDTILFASRNCKGNNGYGYDSSGQVLPVPVLPPILVPPPSDPPPTKTPPPVCSSTTTIITDTPLNQYANETKVVFYPDLVSTTVIAEVKATVIDANSLSIAKSDLGDLSRATTGFTEIHESGPDRISTPRQPTIVHNCLEEPVEITIITDDPNGEITVITSGRPLTSGKEYKLIRYDSLHGSTKLEEIPVDFVDGNTLEFVINETKAGFWVIEENGVEISGNRFEKTLVFVAQCTPTATVSIFPFSVEHTLDRKFNFNSKCMWVKYSPAEAASRRLQLLYAAAGTNGVTTDRWIILDVNNSPTFGVINAYRGGINPETPNGLYDEYNRNTGAFIAGSRALVTNTSGELTPPDTYSPPSCSGVQPSCLNATRRIVETGGIAITLHAHSFAVGPSFCFFSETDLTGAYSRLIQRGVTNWFYRLINSSGSIRYTAIGPLSSLPPCGLYTLQTDLDGTGITSILVS